LRILTGPFAKVPVVSEPDRWSPGWIHWGPEKTGDPLFVRSGAETKSHGSSDPARRGMEDLCQILMNMNEFFYLH
jgi:hypothetical protein